MTIENLFSELWIASFWGPLAVGILLVLIGKAFSGRKQEKTVTFKYVQEVVVKHIIEIKDTQKSSPSRPPSGNSNKSHSSEDPVPMLILMGFLFLSFFYAKYQIEFIFAILGLSTFTVSFSLFTAFFGINNNIVHDSHWSRYLLVTSILALSGYPLMYIALRPIHAPIEVINMSEALVNGGIISMFTLFGLKGVTFLFSQALGFIALTLGILLQIFSLVFYTSAIQLAVSEKARPVVSYIAKITSGFSKPNRVIAGSVVLYCVSFLFISGVGYEWWFGVAGGQAVR